MASYVGSQRNPGHLLEVGEHVKRTFEPSRHKPVAAEVKAFLSTWARYAAASKVRDAAFAKEEAARAALAEADAARDAAVRALDRALIGAGEHRTNPFKRFGAPAASRLVQLRYADETKAIQQLVKAVSAARPLAAEVKKAAQALSRANEAVITAERTVTTAAAAASSALQARDAFDRPVRAALSVLKLQVRVAEKLGLAGAYAELFSTE